MLTADHADLFVSYSAADPDWFRTWGMGQFALSDLACMKEDREAVDVLLCSMPPYIIGLGQPLPMGDTVELEHRIWKVVPGEVPESMKSRHGFHCFARTQQRTHSHL